MEDFVSRRITARFIMRSHRQTYGTNPNITVVLEDITGPVLKKEEEYSRTTVAGQGHMCTMVSADGVATFTEVSVASTSDFETPQQQMPTSTLEIMTNIKFKPAVVQATLLASFASRTDRFCGHVNIAW